MEQREIMQRCVGILTEALERCAAACAPTRTPT